MDDDGFYMAEIDGVRGLVPSNFLIEANDQYGQGLPPGQGKMNNNKIKISTILLTILIVYF